MKIDIKNNKFTIWVFFTPEVHKIVNSLSCICFEINIVNANKKEKGMNLGIIPKRFKIKY